MEGSSRRNEMQMKPAHYKPPWECVTSGNIQNGGGYQSQYGYPASAPPRIDDGAAGLTTTYEDKDKDEAPIFIEQYNNLEFKACFYEHKSTPTIPIVYKINGYIFKYTKLFVYNAFVIVFGFFFSLLWAFTLGLLSFILVWIWTPGFRAIMFTTGRVLPAATEPLKAFFIPLVDVQARLFRQIRVRSWLNGGLMAPLGAAVNKEVCKEANKSV